MKKFLSVSFFVAAFALTATFASAQTGRYSNDRDRYNNNQRYDQRDNRRNNRNWNNRRAPRVVTQTRIVRSGRTTFRETIRVTYLPNGRTQTRVINRVRIR